MLTTEQTALIEKYFYRCEFDDTCDFCSDPKFGTFEKFNLGETIFYVCGKCAFVKAQEIEAVNNKLDKFVAEIDKITKLAEDVGLPVKMNSDNGWDYLENNTWLVLGHDNKTAEANLREWSRKVR